MMNLVAEKMIGAGGREAPQNLDPVLIPFLEAPNEEMAQNELSMLFSDHADPVSMKIIEFRTRNLFTMSYSERAKLKEDLMQEVRLKVLAHLRSIRQERNQSPIMDFKNYLARISHNLLHDYFRSEFRKSGLADFSTISLSEHEASQQGQAGSRAESQSSVPDFAADIEEAEERAIRLKQIWSEIAQLPKNQAAAWLLKVADKDGQSTLKWLPVYKIASIRMIAEAAGMDLMELAKIWNELPLQDQRIALLLKVAPRKVINLRKSANARLQRRLKQVLGRK